MQAVVRVGTKPCLLRDAVRHQVPDFKVKFVSKCASWITKAFLHTESIPVTACVEQHNVVAIARPSATYCASCPEKLSHKLEYVVIMLQIRCSVRH